MHFLWGVKCYPSIQILRLIGVEPITFGTETRHSIQLSYKRRNTIIRKEKIQDLTRSYTTNLKLFNITQPEISLNFGNELDDAIN